MIQKFSPKKTNLYRVDKTVLLQKGLEQYPSVFIEGTSVMGKTTLATMFLEKHPEADNYLLDLGKNEAELEEYLKLIEDNLFSGREAYYVFDMIPGTMELSVCNRICSLILALPENQKIILISRENPALPFEELIWKRSMDDIYAERLMFTKEEVRLLCENLKSKINPDEIYEITEGWPGCVDRAIIIGNNETAENELSGENQVIHHRNMMFFYLKNMIFDNLFEVERNILRIACYLPWINESIVKDMFGIEHAANSFISLSRKGLMIVRNNNGYISSAHVMKKYISEENLKNWRFSYSDEFWESVALWYEKRGYIADAISLYKTIEGSTRYYECVKKHYAEISALHIDVSDVVPEKEMIPEFIFLRGIDLIRRRSNDALRKECKQLHSCIMKLPMCTEAEINEYKRIVEIYLNLQFLNPQVSLNEWISELVTMTPDFKIRIFKYLGTSVSPISGARDLTDLFACAKKEENHMKRVLFAHVENIETVYYMAQAEYYYDTDRYDVIEEKCEELVNADNDDDDDELIAAKLLLLHRKASLEDGNLDNERARKLMKHLLLAEKPVVRANAEALEALYNIANGDQKKAIDWIRFDGIRETTGITEDNYIRLFIRAKILIVMGHYGKAEQIVKRLIPYLKHYRRKRLLIEAYFQHAVIYWALEKKTEALKSCIEAMMLNSAARNVSFFGFYGQMGLSVLMDYENWRSKNAPDGWHRKKKYNYGNVLRMPEADYIDYLIRTVKKRAKTFGHSEEWIAKKEQLTLTEISVLTAVMNGLSNAEIGESMNLKMPTVKSHLYSIYKKLEVSSRLKAVNKAIELGILREN